MACKCSNNREFNKSIKILNNYLNIILDFGNGSSWKQKGFANPFKTCYYLTVFV